MFRMKKKEQALVVTTKEELKAAIKRKEPCIVVKGDLAKKLQWIRKLSPAMLASLIPLLAAAAIPSPVAPLSMAVSTAAVTAITGESLAAIILVCGISAPVLLAVMKDYDAHFKIGEFEFTLTKK